MKTFKKFAIATLAAAAFAGCSSAGDSKTDSTASTSSAAADGELTVIKVGATTSPHGKILEEAKELMKEKGYDLQITEFSDYPNINPSTSDGSLDANYFQHEVYLNGYNADSNLESGDEGYLVSAGGIHYEPLGIYSEKHTKDEEPAEGAQIIIPNDATNEARALLLLQDQGWITLKEGADLNTATIHDIESNPKNLEIVEIAADQEADKLPDVDYAILNGNYALTSNVTDYLLVTEAADSDAAKTYVNIIAVREDKKDDEGIKALVDVLKSDHIKQYITDEFGAFAVPAE